MCAFPLPSMTKILRTICYLCAPPPSLSSNPSRWKLWTLSRTHILAHGQARRRLRSRPGPMAHALPLSYLSLAGQWAPRTQAHMTPFCALPVLSALNPSECRHHWRPDTGGIGRSPSSAGLTRCCVMQTSLPSDDAVTSRRREWPLALSEEHTWPSPKRRVTGARQ